MVTLQGCVESQVGLQPCLMQSGNKGIERQIRWFPILTVDTLNARIRVSVFQACTEPRSKLWAYGDVQDAKLSCLFT
jgi:hypothetical protein